MIYLDYQATTPLAPEVFAAMEPYLHAEFANPHSAHVPGRRAAAAVEVARAEIAALLPDNGRVIFTGGATEAINMAIKGVGAGAIMTNAIEHAAVLDSAEAERAKGRAVHVMPVKPDGLVPVTDIPPDTALVTTMLVNNEIGVIQPVAEMAGAAHRAGALFLCDAVQGYGRVDIPDGCDMIAISAHKIYGPKGIGALWIRDGVDLAPLIHGGGQESGLRSGTLAPALCAGFGMAARLMRERRDTDAAHVEKLWDRALRNFSGWTVNGDVSRRYHGNLNIRRDGVDVARLMSGLRSIAFSAGSACASGSGRPSHVLAALGLGAVEAKSSIRIGFGRYTRLAELDEAAEAINRAAEEML